MVGLDRGRECAQRRPVNLAVVGGARLHEHAEKRQPALLSPNCSALSTAAAAAAPGPVPGERGARSRYDHRVVSSVTSGPSAVTVRVPAKVNLQLAVGPVRADGFHGVVTVYQAIS